MRQLSLLLAAVLVTGGVAAAPALASDACIDLSRMQSTHAIDNQTVIVTLRDHAYRKISLASKCVGLRVQDGFSYATSLAKLCPGDIITVLGGGGDRCGIATITDLTAADAKAMLARR